MDLDYGKLARLLKNDQTDEIEANKNVESQQHIRQTRYKRGRPCCTSFTAVFNKCCCHWIDENLSEFDYKYTKNFRSYEGDNWSCNSCSRGYICSNTTD